MSLDNSVHFSSVNKTTWLDRISKDLKGRSLSDFISNYSMDLELSPFVHAADLNASDFNTLKFERLAHTMPLAIVSEQSPGKANQVARALLSHGAGSVLFREGTRNESPQLTAGINLSVAPVYYGKDDTTQPLIPLDALTSDDQIEEWAKALNPITTGDLNALIISVQCTNNFYLNIASLRAIRIILDQMARDLDQEISFKLIASYKGENEGDIGLALEEAMPIILAAVLGGADHIAAVDIQSNNAWRLHFNLVHLLTLESQIPLNEDLITGSYYLETLTNRVSDRLWNRLINMTP